MKAVSTGWLRVRVLARFCNNNVSSQLDSLHAQASAKFPADMHPRES